jgi:hypothetical protein
MIIDPKSPCINPIELVSGRTTIQKAEKPKRIRGRKALGLPDRRVATSLDGKKFGKLTVLGEVGRNKWGHLQLACECECGNQTITTRGKLTAKDPRQRTTSCGCVKAENFLKFHDRQAGSLPTELSTDIFRYRCYGEDAQAIADHFRVSKATVDAVVRVTRKAVMKTRWMPVIEHGVKHGHDYFTIASRTGLYPSTVGYIAKRLVGDPPPNPPADAETHSVVPHSRFHRGGLETFADLASA